MCNTDSMTKMLYSTTSVFTSLAGRVAVAQVSGVVTRSALDRINAGFAGDLGDSLARVVDYSQAVATINAETLMASVRVAGSAALCAMPVAFLARPDQSQLFEDYCSIARRNGMVRAVFFRPEDARRWAQQQAAVQAHWQELRRGLQSNR